ncbi:MAG: UDP-N-acetylmuramate dehydrogenase [Treponema sp.]|jgi:UDP-N-acetylmuramate dehydrogenase|nr:UDP-N-acetylmuramate dehydrogenase [Treponema sp.]
MLSEFIENINRRLGFRGIFRFDEPMARHTTFKVGGPADLWIRPGGEEFPEYAALLLKEARREKIPVFILGGGANVVIADRGIRGIVLDTGGFGGAGKGGVSPEGAFLTFNAGTSADEAAETAAAAGLSGLEFLAGMPGSVGGALWMNARCYERSVSDGLVEAEYLDGDTGRREKLPARQEDFGYKMSPFQGKNQLILGARFALRNRPEREIRAEMEDHRRDREAKGHYRFPCAGSVFKNNRLFGAPTGQIIDKLGLRGFALGDAQVAPWHGNIIINRGRAGAGDIRNLAELLKARVREELALELESEILFAGDW